MEPGDNDSELVQKREENENSFMHQHQEKSDTERKEQEELQHQQEQQHGSDNKPHTDDGNIARDWKIDERENGSSIDEVDIMKIKDNIENNKTYCNIKSSSGDEIRTVNDSGHYNEESSQLAVVKDSRDISQQPLNLVTSENVLCTTDTRAAKIPLEYAEHKNEDDDGKARENVHSQSLDVTGTVEDSREEVHRPHGVSDDVADDGLESEARAFCTTDYFFNTEQPRSLRKTEDGGLFPALDNVDLETDEESQDVDRDVRKQSGDSNTWDDGVQDLHSDNSKDGENNPEDREKTDEDGTESRLEMTRLEEARTMNELFVKKQAYASGKDIDRADGSITKDYPINYQNYKVCRELGQGIKECLILETGELFICMTKPKSAASESMVSHPDEDDAPGSVFLVQHNGKAYRPDDDLHVMEMVDGVRSQPAPSVVSNSEAFAYVSFQDDDDDPPNPTAAGGTLLQGNQQAYITKHGIPIILDNADDNMKTGLSAAGGTLLQGNQQAYITKHGIPIILDNADDNMKTGLQVTKPGGMGKAVAGSGADGIEITGEDDVSSAETGKNDRLQQQTPYEEKVLASKKSKKNSKSRKKFIELQPETDAVSTEVTASLSESDVNVNCNRNNNNNEEGIENNEEASNVNGNANSPCLDERDHLPEAGRYAHPQHSAYPRDRSHSELDFYTSSYNHSSSLSRGGVLDLSGSKGYPHSSLQSDSYVEGRSLRSQQDSTYNRSREASFVDSSHISTRYTPIQRGDPHSAAAKPESVTVPKFKTLQDQQVSWLEMFKLIEQQHRTELQAQYREHQKILQEMQKNMERELNKQQDTLKHRLTTHRDILEELSPSLHHGSKISFEAQNMNQSRFHEGDSSSVDSLRSERHTLTDHSSHITLQGMPVALRNPPPVTCYQPENREHKLPGELPIKRSLEKQFSSPSCPADTTLSQFRVPISGDKQLKGGVYSSPMPLPRVKHKNSPRESKSYEESQRSSPSQGERSQNTNAVLRGTEEQDVSFTESEKILSPRTRIGLREKHARHLADLRAYYEEELRELRQLLSSSRQDRSGGRDSGNDGRSGMTAGEKILAAENHELRQKCHQFQEAFHDVKVEVRELQQKMQGLEVRASDYAQRYETTQSQVLSLKSRLEELTEYAKEKESIAKDLESKNKKSIDSLQVAYKKEKELTESLHSAKSTIQRLVEKYETLEKEHNLLKASASEAQEKLYSSRRETIEANSKLSRVELENKQLKHDMEILKHDLSIARGALQTRTSYEEAYHTSSSPDRRQVQHSSAHDTRPRSLDRSYGNRSREQTQKEISPESETDSDSLQSPIMRAERELKKLQQSQEFTPKLQRKFYGTEVPSNYGGPAITVNHSSVSPASSSQVSKSFSSRDRKVHMAGQHRESPFKTNISSSPNMQRNLPAEESARLSRKREKLSEFRQQNYKERDHNSSSKNVENGLTSDEAIGRIKSGEIVSRPGWEEIYTSMAQGRTKSAGSKGVIMKSTRDQMIRERLQNIENLERKYDDLSNEKRKYESALSKMPAHGHRGEKDKLEAELDRLDRELGSVRMSLKRFHVLKSTI